MAMKTRERYKSKRSYLLNHSALLLENQEKYDLLLSYEDLKASQRITEIAAGAHHYGLNDVRCL